MSKLSKSSVERRLTTVFAADMVTYSRLMDIDEEGTLLVLNLLLDQVIKPSIREHQGRIVKQMGDGILAEFASVLNAVQCAIEIQRAIAERKNVNIDNRQIQFRIGINTGDIIVQDGDIFGTGVNVAARLESLADPGGVCVSRPVFDQVRNLVDAGFVYLGEYQVKNIADPIHAFKVNLDAPDGSANELNAQALRATGAITARRTKGAARRTLILAIGGSAALIVALALAVMLAQSPKAPPVVQVRAADPERLTTQPQTVTQVIKPPPDRNLLPGVSFRDCNFCPEMVVVPAGAFTMGSDDADTDASPPVEVTVARPFAISKFEITFEEWDACTEGGGCGTYSPDDGGWGRGRQPAINISWNDARAYAFWLSERTGKTYRLPSEAEWEYAAQAGSTQRFPWGKDMITDFANYGFILQKTVPVGSYEANAFGLHDVIGNVAEWVSDCYIEDAYINHRHYPAPVGKPEDNCKRVRRGASWATMHRPHLNRTSRREAGTPDGRYKLNGIRILREIE